MTKTQLHKEYSKTMHEAAEASGRKETIELYKKARSIEKKLYGDDPDYPQSIMDKLNTYYFHLQ